MKREIDYLVLSDIHLGSYGSCAKELFEYLNSIKPKTIILNGDIIDGWVFKKSNFDKYHMKVLRKILKFAQQGVKVHYIIGNHDDFLLDYDGFSFSNVEIKRELTLTIDNKQYLFIHGDSFDFFISHQKWVSHLGSWLYDLLIFTNTFYNKRLTKLGLPKYRFSTKLKKMSKKACDVINNFENMCIDYALKKGYDVVFCGHIHEPKIRVNDDIQYFNTGDWVESLTAFEYSNNKWYLYSHSINNESEDIESN